MRKIVEDIRKDSYKNQQVTKIEKRERLSKSFNQSRDVIFIQTE